jgi:hypothetical protein
MKLIRPAPFLFSAAATAAVLGLAGVYHHEPPPPVPLARPARTLPVMTPASGGGLVFQKNSPAAVQMEEFLFTSKSSEPEPSKVAGVMAAVERLSTKALARECEAALAFAGETHGSEMLQVLLDCWLRKAPGAALDFILVKHPSALDLACRHCPDETVRRFQAATGMSPQEAMLEGKPLAEPWNNTAAFCLAEQRLPANPRTAAAFDRAVAEVNKATAAVSSTDGKEAEAARVAGTRGIQRLNSVTPPAGYFVAAARFYAALHGPAASIVRSAQMPLYYVMPGFSPHDPANQGGQAIARRLGDLWDRDREGLIAAIRAISDQEERDRTAFVIAVTTGCVAIRNDAKLGILMETHSRWQELSFTASLLNSGDPFGVPEPMFMKAMSLLPPGPVKDTGLLNEAMRLAVTDPAAGLTSALAAGAAPQMPEAVKRQFREWSEERPDEAAGWLESQTEDAQRLIAP